MSHDVRCVVVDYLLGLNVISGAIDMSLTSNVDSMMDETKASEDGTPPELIFSPCLYRCREMMSVTVL